MPNLCDNKHVTMTTRFLFRSIATSLLLSLVAVLFSFLVTPRYAAEVQFFVPLTLSEKQAEQAGVGFGGDAEIDAHIQLLRSPSLTKAIALGYPDENVFLDVSRTRYGAVSLSVQSSDAERASDIANRAVALGDSLKQQLLVENRWQSLSFLRQAVHDKEAEVMQYQKKLDSVRAELDDSKKEDASAFRLERLYGESVNELARYTTQLRRAEIALNAPAPKAYVFSEATANEQVVYPNRWLIFFGTLIMAFVLQLFLRTLIRSV